MSVQIAVRIPEGSLRRLDEAIVAGEFDNRADAVRRGLELALAAARERAIAREYRDAYTRKPQDPELGEAAAQLAADVVRREHRAAE